MSTMKLKIISNINCLYKIDGELKGKIKAKEYFVINLDKGEYDFVFLDENDNSNTIEMLSYNINPEEGQKILRINFETISQLPTTIEEQFEKGVDFYYGQNGVTKDYEQAVYWYKKAAEQGDIRAQYNLGDYYCVGRGVTQDYEQEVYWYTKAAEQGHIYAQYNLGECYYNGEGVEQDYEQAVYWFTKSAEQGCVNAKEYLNKLTDKSSEVIKSTIQYMFFDTETTGVPANYKAPSSDTKNWPRLVQLSWIITDEKGNTIKKEDYIIYPDNFSIPQEVSNLHGITTSKAKINGKKIQNVLDLFIADFNKVNYIIGHNILFDKRIVGAELIRLGKKDIMDTKKSYCTMELGTNLCKISGYYGYKLPKLQELYKTLFGHNFNNAHNSLADVQATVECFWQMKKQGNID
jgi:DNA polymerase-3 subunit epsilon